MEGKLSVEKQKRMLSIIKELKGRISELEEMRKELGAGKKASVEDARSLIEEIHVPALEALKEKRKAMS
jgi:hypothetical protein